MELRIFFFLRKGFFFVTDFKKKISASLRIKKKPNTAICVVYNFFFFLIDIFWQVNKEMVPSCSEHINFVVFLFFS